MDKKQKKLKIAMKEVIMYNDQQHKYFCMLPQFFLLTYVMLKQRDIKNR